MAVKPNRIPQQHRPPFIVTYLLELTCGCKGRIYEYDLARYDGEFIISAQLIWIVQCETHKGLPALCNTIDGHTMALHGLDGALPDNGDGKMMEVSLMPLDEH